MSKAMVGVGLILGLKYVFGLVENPHSLEVIKIWFQNFMVNRMFTLHIQMNLFLKKGKKYEKTPE